MSTQPTSQPHAASQPTAGTSYELLVMHRTSPWSARGRVSEFSVLQRNATTFATATPVATSVMQTSHHPDRSLKPKGTVIVTWAAPLARKQHDIRRLDRKTPKDSGSSGGFGPTAKRDDGTLVTAYSYGGRDEYAENDFHVEVLR